ncbi:MAG: hypothetical protein WCC69_04820 [Pirellulales bacterium]
MDGCYCADPALETAVSDSLEFYGLVPSPTATTRRPQPARTLGEQLHRIDLGRKVLALVRRQVPVGQDGRLLIQRLVDSACQRLEEAELPPTDRKYAGASESVVIAYAAAGGGLIGSFESFRRSFVSSAELLEPAVVPVVARQDVKPAPMHDPRRPPNPPGTAAPAKTNPTRTIRSSRWTAGGKAVRS